MRRIIAVTVLFAIAFAFLTIDLGAQGKKAEPASGQRAPARDSTIATHSTPKLAGGKVLVDEEILVGFVDEPDRHFGLARASFLQKDYKTSSAEVLEGANFVKLEAARATGDDKKLLTGAFTRLVDLAELIREGAVVSVDGLDAAFAQAEQALAIHHEMKAMDYWKADNRKGAGQDLRAASMHLGNSMKYAGEKTGDDTKAVIKDADDLGQKLIEGTGQAADKVGKGMQDLGAKIKEWGKKMAASKK